MPSSCHFVNHILSLGMTQGGGRLEMIMTIIEGARTVHQEPNRAICMHHSAHSSPRPYDISIVIRSNSKMGKQRLRFSCLPGHTVNK